MVIPFSNTKLRVPKGFQSLLVGLSTEVLRSQPINIHAFAADYFEKLLNRRDQGQSYLPEKQSSLEDRYYNNQSFQEEYPVNDPEVNKAATKIQANFRGHKARRNVEKMKYETTPMVDLDQEDLGVDRQQIETPDERTSEVEYSQNDQKQEEQKPSEEELRQVVVEPPVDFPAEPLTQEEIEEQDRAARAIQARFRGQKRSPREQKTPSQGTPEPDVKQSSRPSTARRSPGLDNDRQDLGGNITANDQNEPAEILDSDRPGIEREPTQLSEDFERHTQIPQDSEFDREQQENANNNTDEIDLNDPDLEKAATRIQASFRGYKTRKDLGSGSNQNLQEVEEDQAPTTSPPAAAQQQEEEDQDNTNTRFLTPSAEGNQEVEGETNDDDEAAAVKIQAAFRGYKARKELEK